MEGMREGCMATSPNWQGGGFIHSLLCQQLAAGHSGAMPAQAGNREYGR
jgi:hypothetical protein